MKGLLYILLALYHFQFDLPRSVPISYQAQENVDQPPRLFCPPGAPYSPVYFTEYPSNPDYLEFTFDKILIYGSEARTRETELIGCEETWITVQPMLFCSKYNYLPAYLVPMTLQPNHPQESVATSEYTSTQIFGVMYITLTGLIISMVPTSRPWVILGKSPSYIVKLAPSFGRPFLLGLQAIHPQVLRNLSQYGSLTLVSKKSRLN
ncbi:hypothetical protein DSO57_1015284 [Entomophthora muscae]|uniref:Uncharacterized protein n=1 Tax=Entomophthora muscae TaxID=34485 RepID=A0ACC2SU43_9FUNG|nr:hypothetical protein DSO57_1015284 [Entomophthora muscae]